MRSLNLLFLHRLTFCDTLIYPCKLSKDLLSFVKGQFHDVILILQIRYRKNDENEEKKPL